MLPFIKLLPGIAWFFLILYLLTIPGEELPQAGWMDAVPVDKLVHVGLFCGLTFLCCWGILSTKPGTPVLNLVLVVGLLGLGYGIALEFVQKYWVPNRSFDAWDIAADGVGSFLPVLFIRSGTRLLKFQKEEERLNDFKKQ